MNIIDKWVWLIFMAVARANSAKFILADNSSDPVADAPPMQEIQAFSSELQPGLDNLEDVSSQSFQASLIQLDLDLLNYNKPDATHAC
jgi:hypothetical protein